MRPATRAAASRGRTPAPVESAATRATGPLPAASPEKPHEARWRFRVLLSTFLPSIHAIEGYRGARVLRRVIDGEVEFMTITQFESLEAVRKFAGTDYEAAHVAPRARELLSRFETRCQHFEIAFDDAAGSAD